MKFLFREKEKFDHYKLPLIGVKVIRQCRIKVILYLRIYK